MTVEGTGHWSNASSGAKTTTIAYRKLEYTVPLEGTYAFGSGFHEVDQREANGGMIIPTPNRFLVLRPRIGPAGTSCGKGTIDFNDRSEGLAVGIPECRPWCRFSDTAWRRDRDPHTEVDRSSPIE